MTRRYAGVVRGLGLLVLLLVAQCRPLAGAAFEMQQHGSWVSLLVVEGDQIQFRVATDYRHGADHIILAIDHLPGNCAPEALAMSVILDGVTPLPETFDTNQEEGTLRVDRLPPHPLTTTLSYTGGSTAAVVTVERMTEDAATLLAELRRGREVSLALGAGPSGVLRARFSLAGMAAAFERSLALCEVSTPGNAASAARPPTTTAPATQPTRKR